MIPSFPLLGRTFTIYPLMALVGMFASGLYACRSMGDAPEIDAVVYVNSPDLPLEEGGFYRVRVEETDVYDLYACLEGRCEE